MLEYEFETVSCDEGDGGFIETIDMVFERRRPEA